MSFFQRTFSAVRRRMNPTTNFKPSSTMTTTELNISINNGHHLSDEKIPQYLLSTYWWAYIHPNAVAFFERQWLVNAILWGNYKELRDRAFSEVTNTNNVLQIACVYGDFTQTLLQHYMKPDDKLHVIDIAPIQLLNTQRKLMRSCSRSSGCKTVRMYQSNSSDTKEHIQNESMDTVLLFFLLHEMPLDVRKATLKEALRALKTSDQQQQQQHKLVIVDYHKPRSAMNPFRHVMRPVLTYIEPFAIDLWRTELQVWLEDGLEQQKKLYLKIHKETFFGGLYQKVVVTKHNR
eukprot:PhF_6_TR25089/c0_g1_i2/m.34457